MANNSDCPNNNQNSVNDDELPFYYVTPTCKLDMHSRNVYKNADLADVISRRMLHLVLDLDHTLVHATHLPNRPPRGDRETMKNIQDKHGIGFCNDGYIVCELRPGVRDFLSRASSMFDLSIYTMGNHEYANRVARLLQEQVPSIVFKNIITRENCFRDKEKQLEVVLAYENIVLIVDDNVGVWTGPNDHRNLIRIERFEGDPSREDKELERVLEILTEVYNEFYDNNSFLSLLQSDDKDYYNKDVRPMLSRVQQHKGGGN